MIRVREKTAARLREECKRLKEAHEAGVCIVEEYTDRYGAQQGSGVSIDTLLVRLLEQRLQHRQRRRAAAGRRRAGRPSARVDDLTFAIVDQSGSAVRD